MAIPALSVMGVQCVPLPTALLSSHTDGYKDFVFEDTARLFEPYARHWRSEGIVFDAIYCGFLGSYEQIAKTAEIIRMFRQKNTLVVVDPVMGDHGAIYKTYTAEMCEGMRGLVALADIVTPNVTEAAILCGRRYADFPHGDLDAIAEWLVCLGKLAPRAEFLITGVMTGGSPGSIGVARLKHGTARVISRPMEPQYYPGTGDLFASCLVGGLMGGTNMEDSINAAADFTRDAIMISGRAGLPGREGVLLEALLPVLSRYNVAYRTITNDE